MFERFTERARQVIIFAQDEARELNHGYVGTEHILLGLLREEDGLAAQALLSSGVELTSAREAAAEVGNGTGKAGGTLPFTPKAKESLEGALRQALGLGHNYIGTEHILLALLEQGEGAAVQVLHSFGLDTERLNEDLTVMIGRGGEDDNDGLHFALSTGMRRTSSPGSKKGILDRFGRDLTALAREDELDPVIGRETEIERIMQILSRRTKNNPVLLGEPGVGKTAAAEGLANRIAAGDVPETLREARVISLDLAGLVAGTKYRGEFEDRLKGVVKEATADPKIILFIDEIHTLVGAGAAEGAIDAASILKPPLARGELRTIGATTLDEYRKYIERDSALERRFQQVRVDEPSVENTVLILKGLRDRYADHHRVEITDDALEAAAELSDRYLSDRFLPDKAIDLIDEAASRKRLKASLDLDEDPEIRAALNALRGKKEAAIEAEDYALAGEIRDEEEALEKALAEGTEKIKPVVGRDEISDILSMWTGVPAMQMTGDERARLIDMEAGLHRRVIGQDDAGSCVSRAIRRSRAGIKDPNRPIGSFLFLGPTGVGKTELARTLSEFMFGDEDSMIRIDMSEYMEKHSVSRLLGSPPGYVGHEEGGQLTEAVRRKPYSVVLLDEIEKAHPDVFNVLLQLMEDGRLTDSQGRTVDFRNTVVIMTSNLGAGEITHKKALGFTAEAEAPMTPDEIRSRVMGQVTGAFRPEFINRIDETIVFDQLQAPQIREIVDLMLARLATQVGEKSLRLEVSSKAKDFLAEKGWDQSLGARPLRRAIQGHLEDPIADQIIVLADGDVAPGTRIKVDMEKGGEALRVRLVKPRKPSSPPEEALAQA